MPTRAEDYEVLYTIGTGSYGRCQKIRRKSDGKILVWKELDYGSMTEVEKQMLVSEVNLLRELKHPNIVRYYDRIIDRTNTTLYIVMEYCEGGDLASVITKGTKERQYLDEEFVLRVMTQLTLALKECHRRSDGGHTVLHRDLKPANVFLDGKQNVKLGDFGLARILNHDMSFAKTFVGTPYYMSPCGLGATYIGILQELAGNARSQVPPQLSLNALNQNLQFTTAPQVKGQPKYQNGFTLVNLSPEPPFTTWTQLGGSKSVCCPAPGGGGAKKAPETGPSAAAVAAAFLALQASASRSEPQRRRRARGRPVRRALQMLGAFVARSCPSPAPAACLLLLLLRLFVPGLREPQRPAAAASAASASAAQLWVWGLLGLSRASAPALSTDA
ncbi:cyclin-dependent kinase 1-like [Leptonychotes weddellii]|uniref:non-specific serine/threonine protein kinase n=1 Tax=Leptonychotes weddellii TaxID=9713 RepID=A0A2U3YVS6_LEPWE|nr:cyclin-dependent kinase 1-like [Leptonychotes weddellii]